MRSGATSPAQVPPRSKARPGDGAAQHLRDARRLPAGDRDARPPRALAQTGGDLRQEGLVHLLHEHAVDHRDRLRAHADDVVRVHGDAVDAGRVELAQRLGDERLRADRVGGEGKRLRPARIDDGGVVPESEERPRPPGEGERLG